MQGGRFNFKGGRMLYILFGINFFFFLWLRESLYGNELTNQRQIKEINKIFNILEEEIRLLKKINETVFDELEINMGDRESIRFVEWLREEYGLRQDLEQEYYNWEKQKEIEKKAVEGWLQQKDEPAVQYNLGVAYHFGWGVEQDNKIAFDWMLKSAENFWSPAKRNIGMAYFLGKIVEQDDEKAFKYWNDAAECDTEAQFLLGIAYANGIGVEKNMGKAISCLKDAAQLHHPMALYYLGNHYYGASKGSRELGYRKKVFDLWHQAAEQNIAEAQRNLGCAYYEGYGVQQNYDEAIRWWELASEQFDEYADDLLLEHRAG